MKFLVWILLLGTTLNLAIAQTEEASAPKFTNLVKSTMDLLGPEEAMAEDNSTEDLLNQSLKKSLNAFATLSSGQPLDQSCE
jgi:hypothetical protein